MEARVNFEVAKTEVLLSSPFSGSAQLRPCWPSFTRLSQLQVQKFTDKEIHALPLSVSTRRLEQRTIVEQFR